MAKIRFRVEASCFLRNSRAVSVFSGGSALIVTTSKSRPRYIRWMVTSSGNSVTQGPDQVAHTLTSRSLFVGFLTSSLIPASSTASRPTGSAAHRLKPSATDARFSDHLIEQPNTLVVATGTG